ncbi:major histocompatibility complex class I-related gene protein-like [Aplochiton taeniatus]
MYLHFLHRHCIASQGSLYPRNIQFVMVDDIIVYYHNSSSEQQNPMPEWLNHPDGIAFWTELNNNLLFNRYVMNDAVKLTSDRFNHSHEHIYQAHGRCGWHPDGTIEAFMNHAYDGKDFVHFDVPTRSWIAAVSDALFYKKARESNLEDLHRLINHYEYGCIRWLNKLLKYSAGVREPRVPTVRLFKRQPSSDSKVEVTCHLTGFYPREVQVEWLDAEGLPLVEGVSSGEVLPNGDGSYQLRKSVMIPKGDLQSVRYSCLVLHSSVEGNVTVTWVPKKSVSPISLTVGGIFSLLFLLVMCVMFKKGMLRELIPAFKQPCVHKAGQIVPTVHLFKRQPSSDSKVEVTCHLTGFYPREVQVEWLDAEGLPLVEGVSSGEVLPNGDGSYQLRKSVMIPKGDLQSVRYSCLVLHSSVEGNVTVTWGPSSSF